MQFRSVSSLYTRLKEKFFSSRFWTEIAPARFLRRFCGLFCGIMLLWLLIVIFIDPYMFWHRAVGFHQVYSNTYAMIPSILRHFDYDTVLIGSSLTKNFRISDINSELGCQAVKATAAGAHGDDWLAFMTEAVETGKVKRFVLCADLWAFTREEKPNHHQPYHYMYGHRNFFPYVFSFDTVKAVGDVLRSHFADRGKRKFNQDFDTVFFDAIERYTYSRTQLERTVREEYTPPPRVKTDPGKYFEMFIFSMARKHPDIRFDLFLAPCSIYMWCGIREHNDLEAYLDTRIRLARECAKYPNVRIYDFQANEDIICNLDNYKDITHYSPAINYRILQLIAASAAGDSVDSVDNANKKLRTLVDRHMTDFMRLRQSGTEHPEN